MSKTQFLKVLTVSATLMFSGAHIHNAAAQDASADHIAAAKAAITALTVTKNFDSILLRSAEQIKANLTLANPNFSDEISIAVDEEAIKLASRRADLENEAANIYAKNFTVEELNEITTFYNSATGKKLIQSTAGLGRELVRAAEIWGAGITRDLNEASSKVLTEKLNNKSE
ncbi:MAG: DUF2059 domain-containing protein [Rhizobiaceae bacterium]|nr:DUF2059 domain-containing protein [Rhizobiaceae bacterium]